MITERAHEIATLYRILDTSDSTLNYSDYLSMAIYDLEHHYEEVAKMYNDYYFPKNKQKRSFNDRNKPVNCNEFYYLLNLTKSEFRKEYKKLSLKYHPDRCANGAEMMTRINQIKQSRI